MNVNKLKYLSLACLLVASSANAGTIHLVSSKLRPTDLIDIAWTSQYGDCPTKFPTQSMNCSYTSTTLTIEAQNLSKIGDISTSNTYTLNIDLNPKTKERPLPFKKLSCQNLQNKLSGKSKITISRRGCKVSS